MKSSLTRQKNRRLLFFAGLQSRKVATAKNLQLEGFRRVPVPVDGHCLINAWHVLSNDRPSEPVSKRTDVCYFSPAYSQGKLQQQRIFSRKLVRLIEEEIYFE